MHEFSIVEATVRQIVEQLEAQRVYDVAEICLRRGVTMSDEVVRQAFRMVTDGTPLANAELRLDVAAHTIRCGCGYRERLEDVEVPDHVFVCPKCGAAHMIDGDLLEFVYAMERETETYPFPLGD